MSFNKVVNRLSGIEFEDIGHKCTFFPAVEVPHKPQFPEKDMQDNLNPQVVRRTLIGENADDRFGPNNTVFGQLLSS